MIYKEIAEVCYGEWTGTETCHSEMQDEVQQIHLRWISTFLYQRKRISQNILNFLIFSPHKFMGFIASAVSWFFRFYHLRTGAFGLSGGGKAVTFLSEKFPQFPNAWLLKSVYERTQIAWIRKTNSFTNYHVAEIFRASLISRILDFQVSREKKREFGFQT